MPKAEKHPRPHPGCGSLIDYGTRYCSAHQTVADTHKRETARVYDDKRTEVKFYHSARWKRLRDWYIKQHPLCEMYLGEGRIVEACLVDHIVEISDSGARYD